MPIVFFMPGHRKSRNAASNLTTGLHHEPHPTKCPSVDTCKIFGSSCPRCFVDDPYLDVLCRSKSGCGPTNDQAVDSPHNVLTSNAFPNNVPTKVSPNRRNQRTDVCWWYFDSGSQQWRCWNLHAVHRTGWAYVWVATELEQIGSASSAMWSTHQKTQWRLCGFERVVALFRKFLVWQWQYWAWAE